MMFSGLIPPFTKSVYTRQGSYTLSMIHINYAGNRVIEPIISSAENHGILLSQCNRKDNSKDCKSRMHLAFFKQASLGKCFGDTTHLEFHYACVNSKHKYITPIHVLLFSVAYRCSVHRISPDFY